MKEYYRYEFDVPPDAVDSNNHVNNVVYVQWMQDAAMKHYYNEGGLEINAREHAAWFVHGHQVEYKRPAFGGDRIAVYTWVMKFGAVTSPRGYAFVRVSDGAILVRGKTQWVFVDATTGKPKHIPDEVLKRFEEMPEHWLPMLS